ncbi:MAG TPA: sigma-54 dependent transcriptional regulator [Bacteroidota bacterium]|nr:sigma-54 dependent transcriptional regulator [Bacteroidota bacterium]
MKTKRTRLLIVDDDEKILFAFEQLFRKEGYDTVTASDGEQALELIGSVHPDAVIMDITMPKLDGLETLKRVKQLNSTLPVILITGFGTMQTAIRAMQLGAFEYMTKPLDVIAVRDVVHRALASTKGYAAPSGEPVSFQSQILNRYDIIGRNPQMHEVFKLIGSISTTPNHTSILILGESGTGKELVARAIHANGPHAGEPFVAINCTALPETLLESELFGYEKGAFTGAAERKLGKFDVASSGTVFLDEIGSLSPPLQQKLLRVLQEREFERVGGNETHAVEARFIAATNQDLAAEVKRKTFREDLFFRLNVVTIHLPPLRNRAGDIQLLASYFLGKYNEQLKRNVRGFSAEALEILNAYSYPGNVRELENLIERAVMLSKGEIVLPDAFGDIQGQAADAAVTFPLVSPSFSKSREHVLELFERQFLAHQLRVYRGNVTEAASASRMTRQNFQRLMKKHRISSRPYRS